MLESSYVYCKAALRQGVIRFIYTSELTAFSERNSADCDDRVLEIHFLITRLRVSRNKADELMDRPLRD